jgi:flavin-binding protein dodecin
MTGLFTHGGSAMSVARNTEISATSPTSFEDAIRVGLSRATRTLRNVKGAWIKEQEVELSGDQISEYKVTMIVTFVLDDGSSGDD